MAKRLQSIDLPGRRTRNWLRTKHYQPETFLEVAVEVSFLGWASGRLRHPAYAGLTRLL